MLIVSFIRARRSLMSVMGTCGACLPIISLNNKGAGGVFARGGDLGLGNDNGDLAFFFRCLLGVVIMPCFLSDLLRRLLLRLCVLRRTIELSSLLLSRRVWALFGAFASWASLWSFHHRRRLSPCRFLCSLCQCERSHQGVVRSIWMALLEIYKYTLGVEISSVEFAAC